MALLTPSERYGRTRVPVKIENPKIPLQTKLMAITEDNGILIRLLPYAKLAIKASIDSVDDRTTASEIIIATLMKIPAFL